MSIPSSIVLKRFLGIVPASRTLFFARTFSAAASADTSALAAAATAPTPANNNKNANAFNKSRTEYEKQLHEIRKQLQANIKRKEELAEISNIEEKRQIVIKKAISRRSKTSEAIVRQQKLLATREEFKKLGREKLATNTLLNQSRDDLQQLRYKRYIEDLEKEKSLWLKDQSSITAKLTGDFFSKPSTTGYKTSSTKHWRYHVKSLSLKRFIDEDLDEFGSGTTLLERVASNNNSTSLDKRVTLYETLDKMVATGTDREALEKLMDDYVHHDDTQKDKSSTLSDRLRDLGVNTDDFNEEELEMLKEQIKLEFGVNVELDTESARPVAVHESSAAEDEYDKEDVDEMIRALNTHDPNEIVPTSDLDGDGDAAPAAAKQKTAPKMVKGKVVVKKGPVKGKGKPPVKAAAKK